MASVDQEYDARQAAKTEEDQGAMLLASHPELLKMVRPDAPAAAPTSPQGPGQDGIPTADQEALQASSLYQNITHDITSRTAEHLGASPKLADRLGNLTKEVTGDALMAGGISRGPGTLAGATEAAASGAEKVSTILGADGQPMASAVPAATETAATAPEAVAGTPAQTAATPEVMPEHATPEAAAQTLAERQIEKLKAVRVGASVAEEFGRPDIATTIPQSLTVEESQALRQSMESYYSHGADVPLGTAKTQALASDYQGENEAIHAMNLDIRRRALAGEDVTKDLDQLVNRYSAYAENYSTLAGTRSDLGRRLQILDPNKPGNAFVAATAKIAQEASIEGNPERLSELLAQLKPEQFARVGDQMATDVSMGRSLYDAFNEYYVNNLLSNVGRTSSRIATSNAVSALLTIPQRTIESVIPGSGVAYGTPLARIQGLVDGFWHSADVGLESLKTGSRASQIEGGSVSPFIDNHKAITGQAFGLDDTWLGTGIDYFGNVLRLGNRLLTGVHQFGHSMATSMATHDLAWNEAVDAAHGEGLSGMEGYGRATELYHGLLNDLPAEMRLNASKSADIVTFANQLEKGTVGGWLQEGAQFPVVKQLMPFMKVGYNVQKMGMDMTPGVNVLSTAPDLIMGNAATRSAAVAKIAFGSLMGVVISHEYHQGNIVLDQYGSPQFKIGDNLVEVPEPLRFPIGFVGNYLQNRDRMTDAEAVDSATAVSKSWAEKVGSWGATRVAAGTQAFGSASADSSIVQTLVNLKKLWNATSSGEKVQTAVERFIGEESSGLIPWSALLHAVASGTDPLKRDPQTIGQQLQTNIPTTSMTAGSQAIQPKYDIFNNPTPNPTLGLPQALVYPVHVVDAEKDSVVKEIKRLGINPERPPSFLNDEQAHKWNGDRAEGLHDRLAAYINNKGYKDQTDPFNKSFLENLIGIGTHIANVNMLADPKIAQLIISHKLAVQGLDMGDQAVTTNEFGVEGPSTTAAPIPQQPDLSVR